MSAEPSSSGMTRSSAPIRVAMSVESAGAAGVVGRIPLASKKLQPDVRVTKGRRKACTCKQQATGKQRQAEKGAGALKFTVLGECEVAQLAVTLKFRSPGVPCPLARIIFALTSLQWILMRSRGPRPVSGELDKGEGGSRQRFGWIPRGSGPAAGQGTG